MCGICGFTGEPDGDLLKRMADRIVHRGPDEEGYYSDGHVNLGMRRLSILDLATGRQPIHNEDSTLWTVFNGEIYDYAELRAELADRHRFCTDHSDTELVLHLYEEHGDDWPLRVNGMFAVALWDSPRRRLLLYRDRIGKKPLYYAHKSGQLIFGSEIKSLLLHPAVSRELDYGALYHYFGLKNTTGGQTAYADIRQLPQGSMLVWQDGQVTVRPYWRVDFSAVDEAMDETEAADRLLAMLADSVRLRMRCDVSFGAYLSGGVDSSSVVTMMSRFQSRPIKTFALGYDDEAGGQFAGKKSDIEYARLMARRLGTDHHEHIVSAAEFARSMPQVLEAFDEPFSGTVSTFLLTTLIARHVKVALSGDGADELFGSYLAHRLALPIQRYVALARAGRREWDSLDEPQRRSLWPFDSPAQFAFLRSVASPRLAEWRGRLMVFSPEERRGLLSDEFLARADDAGADPYQRLAPSLTAADELNRSLEIDQRELLPNQVLPFVDRLSMAHSVEVRCPYLDYRIIELANRIPGRLKIRKPTVKFIHKKAMERILPRDLLERPKEGFVQPIYSWMRGSLRDWTLDCLRSLPERFVKPAAVAALADRFLAGQPGLEAKVWNLACLSLWLRNC